MLTQKLKHNNIKIMSNFYIKKLLACKNCYIYYFFLMILPKLLNIFEDFILILIFVIF